MKASTLNANHTEIAGWIQPYLARMLTEDYAVVVLFYQGNGFLFNQHHADQLNGMPLVVLDMREFGWDFSWRNRSILGWTKDNFDCGLYPEIEEYEKFAQWIRSQGVIAYFKRELARCDVTEILIENRNATDTPFASKIHPIDLLSFSRGAVPPPNREEFLRRKGGIFFLYGNSHPDRLALHGELQKVRNSASNSINIANRVLMAGYETDLLEQVHFISRYALAQVMQAQGLFRLSIALGGCGNKTFRTSEIINAVPVISDVGMQYAVEWNDSNAIMLPTENGRLVLDKSVQIIQDALLDPEALWNVMQGAHQAQLELEPGRYIDKYINQIIKASL